jgi:hypothetical protein
MHQQTLHKTEKGSPAYLDPQIAMRTNIHTSRQEAIAYFVKPMIHYRDKEMLVVLFNTSNHWVIQSISTKYDQVWYYDSSRPTDTIIDERLTHDVIAILNE